MFFVNNVKKNQLCINLINNVKETIFFQISYISNTRTQIQLFVSLLIGDTGLLKDLVHFDQKLPNLKVPNSSI